jgi:predicted transcriptional regulator
MMTKVWDELPRRVQSWPEDAQDALAQVASEIQAELNGRDYRASPSELQGIDRGLRDAADGKFATQEQVEGVFAKYRR